MISLNETSNAPSKTDRSYRKADRRRATNQMFIALLVTIVLAFGWGLAVGYYAGAMECKAMIERGEK